MIEYLKITDENSILSYLRDFEDCFPHLKEKVNLTDFSKKLADNAEVYIAFSDEKAVGITCFYANDNQNFCGFITLIGISFAYQKCGMGKELLNFTFEKMNELGMKSVKLEVDNDNINAQGFYAHFGFVKAEELPQSFYMFKELQR